jgi:metal-responsive CopG/Arc/MetJ family transcriptional regulator
MITGSDELLADIDNAAQYAHRSRSEFFQAVRRYLKQVKRSRTPVGIEAVGLIERLRTQAVQRARQANDSTEVIRSFRGSLDENTET